MYMGEKTKSKKTMPVCTMTSAAAVQKCFAVCHQKTKAIGYKPQHSFCFILRFLNIDNQRNLRYESYEIGTVDTRMQRQTNTPHRAHTH